MIQKTTTYDKVQQMNGNLEKLANPET
jgi:hypothetical protein